MASRKKEVPCPWESVGKKKPFPGAAAPFKKGDVKKTIVPTPNKPGGSNVTG